LADPAVRLTVATVSHAVGSAFTTVATVKRHAEFAVREVRSAKAEAVSRMPAILAVNRTVHLALAGRALVLLKKTAAPRGTPPDRGAVRPSS
jgi:hypothetical protein